MLSEPRFWNWTLKARLRVLGVTFGDEVDPMTDEDFMKQCGIKKEEPNDTSTENVARQHQLGSGKRGSDIPDDAGM
jgi:hypothetical protein